MIPVKHIDPDDIALYAMQLLPQDESEEMSLHLQHSAEARRVLSEIYSDLAVFAHSAEMHSPPALARQRLMKHVAREKKALPPDPLANRAGAYAPRNNVVAFEDVVEKKSAASNILPWLGWAIAAGIGAFSFTQYTQNQSLQHSVTVAQNDLKATRTQAEVANTLMETLRDNSAVHFNLTSTDLKPPPSAKITYIPEKGSLLLIATNLDKLAPYKTYELWLIPQDGHDPIPAGTFKPDERGFASVVLPELPKGVEAKTFGVTIEDGDGAATPTMPIVLKGQAS
jgi:anti-sigma-K factor RskA